MFIFNLIEEFHYDFEHALTYFKVYLIALNGELAETAHVRSIATEVKLKREWTWCPL